MKALKDRRRTLLMVLAIGVTALLGCALLFGQKRPRGLPAPTWTEADRQAIRKQATAYAEILARGDYESLYHLLAKRQQEQETLTAFQRRMANYAAIRVPLDVVREAMPVVSFVDQNLASVGLLMKVRIPRNSRIQTLGFGFYAAYEGDEWKICDTSSMDRRVVDRETLPTSCFESLCRDWYLSPQTVYRTDLLTQDCELYEAAGTSPVRSLQEWCEREATRLHSYGAPQFPSPRQEVYAIDGQEATIRASIVLFPEEEPARVQDLQEAVYRVDVVAAPAAAMPGPADASSSGAPGTKWLIRRITPLGLAPLDEGTYSRAWVHLWYANQDLIRKAVQTACQQFLTDCQKGKYDALREQVYPGSSAAELVAQWRAEPRGRSTLKDFQILRVMGVWDYLKSGTADVNVRVSLEFSEPAPTPSGAFIVHVRFLKSSGEKEGGSWRVADLVRE